MGYGTKFIPDKNCLAVDVLREKGWSEKDGQKDIFTKVYFALEQILYRQSKCELCCLKIQTKKSHLVECHTENKNNIYPGELI